MVFLGNSITAGWGLSDPLQSFPSLLARRFEEEGRNIKVINAGISGETTGGALRRLDLILEYTIDLMVIELGINDYIQGASREECLQNLRRIVQKTRAAHPEAEIVITDIRLAVFAPDPAAVDFQQLYAELARSEDLELMPSYLDEIWTNSDLVMPDRLHPNAAGYEVIAQLVYQALRPHFNK